MPTTRTSVTHDPNATQASSVALERHGITRCRIEAPIIDNVVIWVYQRHLAGFHIQ